MARQQSTLIQRLVGVGMMFCLFLSLSAIAEAEELRQFLLLNAETKRFLAVRDGELILPRKFEKSDRFVWSFDWQDPAERYGYLVSHERAGTGAASEPDELLKLNLDDKDVAVVSTQGQLWNVQRALKPVEKPERIQFLHRTRRTPIWLSADVKDIDPVRAIGWKVQTDPQTTWLLMPVPVNAPGR